MRRLALFALTLLAAGPAAAYDGPVEKQVFTLDRLVLANGAELRDVKVGFETYGRLNAAKDNVIVICHHITGNSHAAGRYAAGDPAPGYWDAIIGAGKPIDTDRFFVIATDTLVNPNPKSPQVITTGPATINPATGKPWGMDFPIVSSRDIVAVQKALLDTLGIARVHAVAGASAGAAQAAEWAAAYPDVVGRFVSVVGPGVANRAYIVGMLDLWGMPIRLDPRWNRGDYYGRDEPADGVVQTLKLVTFDGVAFDWADQRFGLAWADKEKNPGQAYRNQFAIEAGLTAAGAARAKTFDANSWLYTTRAYQLSQLDARRIKAPGLFVAVTSDRIFPPFLSKQAVATLRAQGNEAEYVEIDSGGGHLDGITNVAAAGKVIADFLR
jgi:homoserine O-acetyltransferase